MQDSRWALTRAEQRGRIPSLDMLATCMFTRLCVAAKPFWFVCNSFSAGSQHPVAGFLAAIVANTSGM